MRDVLKKILKTPAEAPTAEEKLLEDFFLPEGEAQKAFKKRPGRPLVEKHLKARNFTVCLAPEYLTFVDNMKVRDPKVQGRGRKIRFIIDQFMELHKRQKLQLQVISESLAQLDVVLKGFSSQVKKGQKLSLTPKEKAEITKSTNQVKLLIGVLKFSSKDLQKKLKKSDWALLSFCLNWSHL